MADTNKTEEVIKRVNYFDRQFLRAKDFIAEQQYHLKALRYHNQNLHSWGIVRGLDIISHSEQKVTVSSGMAIDSDGRQIIITEDTELMLPENIAAGVTSIYLTISYEEYSTDQSEDAGIKGNTRITEKPKLEFVEKMPDDSSKQLILATVNLNENQKIAEISLEARIYSGTFAGRITFALPVEADKWPFIQGFVFKLTISANNLEEIANQLKEIHNLQQENSNEIIGLLSSPLFVWGPCFVIDMYAMGKVGIGTITPGYTLDVNGIINYSQLVKLDVGDNLTAIVRAAEFKLGHSSRKGSTGRALVDYTDTLHINDGSDWRYTRINGEIINIGGKLRVVGGDWNVSYSEGDFRIGDDSYRLKIGVAIGGAGAGDVRIRAQGGTNRMMLGGGSSDTLIIMNDKVGIKTYEPAYSLDVNGDANISGQLYQGSSQEIKTNITDFSGKEAVELLNELNPVRFNYKSDPEGRPNIGFIAEDTPESLTDPDRRSILPIDMLAVLTKVVKEQQEAITKLQEEVKNLHQTIQTIQTLKKKPAKTNKTRANGKNAPVVDPA